MYGTQTLYVLSHSTTVFENDVNMYGTQTAFSAMDTMPLFENDVNMYRTQTKIMATFGIRAVSYTHLTLPTKLEV